MSNELTLSAPRPVKVYGRNECGRAHAIRDLLHRADVPFEWTEVTTDELCRELNVTGPRDRRLPLCIFPDGTRLERPTNREIVEKLGWFRDPSRSEYDVAIYGAVEVLPHMQVTALHGDLLPRSITLTNNQTGQQQTVDTHFLFLCLGGQPHTQWAADVGICRDEDGYLVIGPGLNAHGVLPEKWPLERAPYYLETSLPGLFAAGDVRHGSVKRCACAVGEGAMAVTFVHRYLSTI